jgi:hypothetical protein
MPIRRARDIIHPNGNPLGSKRSAQAPSQRHRLEPTNSGTGMPSRVILTMSAPRIIEGTAQLPKVAQNAALLARRLDGWVANGSQCPVVQRPKPSHPEANGSASIPIVTMCAAPRTNKAMPLHFTIVTYL